jgi:Family of unknown function (DUF6812)
MSLLQIARSRPETAVDEPEAPADEPVGGLLPVELFTASGRELAWISSGDERTSDWLNHGDTISLHSVAALPLDATLPGLMPPDPAADLPDVERLAADVLMVVPPALPPNRHLRLHRRIEEVRMELGGFGVAGRVHIRPGATAGDYLLRGNRRFVPVTNVELTHHGEKPWVRQVGVVIVNVTQVTLLDRGLEAASRAAEPATSAATLPDAAAPEDAASGIDAATMLSVRGALEQLAELANAKLITATEHRRKRAEVLARL